MTSPIARLAPSPAAPRTGPLAEVLAAVAARGNHACADLAELAASPLGRRLERKLARREKLVFLLPAFPAKSSNREKTHGPRPDLGELLALQNLEQMCREIEAAYGPGAEVVICSDGRVFNDLVMVSDADLDAYSRRIEELIEAYGLTHLKSFSLDDCHEILDGDQVREDLVARFGPALEEIREAVKTDPQRRSMFNGIHRFMTDDLAYHHPELSRTQLRKRSKALAYQVVQRSQSWDNILETIFPETLRLSIHPYPMQHRKFGVQLVPSADRWATPWHNVVVLQGGCYRLMKRREALALGAEPRFHDQELAYYAL